MVTACSSVDRVFRVRLAAQSRSELGPTCWPRSGEKPHGHAPIHCARTGAVQSRDVIRGLLTPQHLNRVDPRGGPCRRIRRDESNDREQHAHRDKGCRIIRRDANGIDIIAREATAAQTSLVYTVRDRLASHVWY
jgi:hypothetical protein